MMKNQRFDYAAVALNVCWALGLLLGLLGSSAAAAQQLVVEAKRVVALQREPENPSSGRYDWGPSVMKDGEVYRMLVHDGCLAIYYASGLGFKDKAYTWDLHRCEVEIRLLQRAGSW